VKWTAVGLLVSLIALSGCGGSDDGDVETFCTLVQQGAGDLTGQAVDAASLDRLAEVAPQEIRSVVEQLGNLARDFSEIDPTELDQLFAAAFDAPARSARQRFDRFVSDTCDIENATLGGDQEPAAADELAVSLLDFLESVFPNDDWVGNVRYEVIVEPEDGPWAVRLTFVVDIEEGEAARACQSVSVWLYNVEEHAGSIEVLDAAGDGGAARAGLEGSCVER
jgi:hypothetical protein